MSKAEVRRPRAEALAIAEKVVEVFEPFSAKVEIAGSIRRGKATCGDVDIVVQAGYFWDGPMINSHLVEIGARFVTRHQEQWQINLEGINVDVSFAVRETYAMKLLWRTGPFEHNISLAQAALRKGLKIRKTGVVDRNDKVVAWESEEAIFEAVGVEYKAPENRN